MKIITKVEFTDTEKDMFDIAKQLHEFLKQDCPYEGEKDCYNCPFNNQYDDCLLESLTFDLEQVLEAIGDA